MSRCKDIGPAQLICTESEGHQGPHAVGDSVSWSRSVSTSTTSRIDELLEANTVEVERRRDAEAKIQAIYNALDAAERAAETQSHLDPKVGIPCTCSTCIVVRGIRAFIKAKK